MQLIIEPGAGLPLKSFDWRLPARPNSINFVCAVYFNNPTFTSP